MDIMRSLPNQPMGGIRDKISARSGKSVNKVVLKGDIERKRRGEGKDSITVYIGQSFKAYGGVERKVPPRLIISKRSYYLDGVLVLRYG
jgi:hypothetical protein